MQFPLADLTRPAGSSDDDTFYDRTTKAKPGAGGGGAKKGKAGGGAKQEVGAGAAKLAARSWHLLWQVWGAPAGQRSLLIAISWRLAELAY